MSRPIAIALICLVLLLSATAAWIWFQYLRYPDMPPPTTQASDTLRIRPPTDARCQELARDELLRHVILVRLHKYDLDEHPAITVNDDALLGWPKAAELLHDIYKVRAERVAFLQSTLFGFRLLFHMRRYTFILSDKVLALKQELLGLHWTRRYPRGEIHNLHLRYALGQEFPKLCELTFEQNKITHNFPVQMTLPDAQNLKAAIYSRFPQLAPERPFFWQV